MNSEEIIDYQYVNVDYPDVWQLLKTATNKNVGMHRHEKNSNLEAKAYDNSPDLPQLDILQDYDRDIWSGPDAWTDEQWKWKKLLKWDRNCDYIGDVKAHDINDRIQLVTVQCVPGAYQAMYYVFLFDKTTNGSKQLNLGLPQSTDNPKEISGTIEYNREKRQMSILTHSRGVGDCGTYRLFSLFDSDKLDTAVFQQTEMREQECRDYGVDSVDQIPKSVFDYKRWPLVK
jgi:hypothetical protein